MFCLVIFAAHTLGLAAAAQKAVLTLDPPWSTMFEGDSVTLTCRGPHSSGRTHTSWYLEGQSLNSTETNILHIKAAEVKDTGKYQCQTSGFTRSDPVQLTVSEDWLILQIPYTVFEGDQLVLRCRGWKDRTVSDVRYYRNGTDIAPSHTSSSYTIQQAKTTDSGGYHCTGSVGFDLSKMSPMVPISVQELFSTPELRVASSTETSEGSPLTLKCVTQLNPQKPDLWLQYTFYKSRRIVKRPTSSPVYQIAKVGLTNSGLYSCAVRMMTSSIRKQSPELNVQVKQLFSTPELRVAGSAEAREGSPLTLQCVTQLSPWKSDLWLQYSFYKNGTIVKGLMSSSMYQIAKVGLTDSGLYSCMVRAVTSDIWKQSPKLNIEVKQLFSTPELRVAGLAKAIEGNPLTLQCVMQSNPWTPDQWLQYSFYKSSMIVRGPTSSPEYQIPEAGLADSGPYSCVVQAVTFSVQKRSPEIVIEVKRVPVSGVTLGVQPRHGQVVAGEQLVLSCSVAAGTGPLTFSWHREGSGLALWTATLRTWRADYEIPAAMESDAGEYYCAASNGHNLVLSPRVTVTVWVPVSSPVLTLSAAGSWAAIGDAVEIQCESHHGSVPVVYRFHHEGALLGTRTVSAYGPGSITINLTSESDSGAYSCEADNGVGDGPQRSALSHLAVLVPVAGATITTDRAQPVLMVGESLNLSCSVQVGTDPVFRWLHNAQELDAASGLGLPSPVGHVLYVESVQLGHAGNYQCIASNQLSPQRVFLAPSEILVITVREETCFSAWRRSTLDPEQQEPPPQELSPLAAVGSSKLDPTYGNVYPQEQGSGDVVYSVVSIKKGGRDRPMGTPLRKKQEYLVTYAVLPYSKLPRDSATRARASEERDQPMSDIYENILRP
ncbi:Fc receptor-like protein 5 [Alligator mississippiensis]|uniref:Fc receptor-like protein 5 n=1 Tax=Alligator mississippiensis TaxID=8496 RepID=A0A151NKN6_ALLMI|nr:Fc receptor-like protein 5 [Alligator mississippiensis]